MQKTVQEIVKIISDLQKQKNRLLIAIDGRSNAGKTTLAGLLREACDCNIIQMDHFFLPRDVQEQNEQALAGGNIDFDRLQNDVISPLKRGELFSYRPFNCALQEYDDEIAFSAKAVNIIEGAYSCHPKLWQDYDLRLFLDIDPQEQKRRLLLREGAQKAEVFLTHWIPLEEAYFAEYDIANRCDLCLEILI